MPPSSDPPALTRAPSIGATMHDHAFAVTHDPTERDLTHAAFCSLYETFELDANQSLGNDEGSPKVFDSPFAKTNSKTTVARVSDNITSCTMIVQAIVRGHAIRKLKPSSKAAELARKDLLAWGNLDASGVPASSEQAPAASGPRRIIVLYSAAFLYSQSLLKLESDTEESRDLASCFLTKPVSDEAAGRAAPITLHRFCECVDAILSRHDKGEPIPAYEGQKWLGVSPGQRCIQRVSRLLKGLGGGTNDEEATLGSCCSVIGVRNYDNVAGAACKISWAQALAGEHGSKYTVDVGGKGNLKLLDGLTSEPMAELEDNDISGDGSALLAAVHSLLDNHKVAYGDAVLGMTGKWRDGSASQHPNAAAVLATMSSPAAGFAHAGLVSEDKERQWEHSSARRAAAEVLRWPELSDVSASALPILTVGSGSSTTQVGMSGSWPACTTSDSSGRPGTGVAAFKGITIGFGMHIKPPAGKPALPSAVDMDASFASASDAARKMSVAGQGSAAMSKAEQQLRQAFSLFDVNGNGSLDKDEFRGVLMASCPGGKPLSEEEVTRMFSFVDANKDGKVDIDEWVGWWRKNTTV